MLTEPTDPFWTIATPGTSRNASETRVIPRARSSSPLIMVTGCVSDERDDGVFDAEITTALSVVVSGDCATAIAGAAVVSAMMAILWIFN